jgi:uncharacterized protein YoxC
VTDREMLEMISRDLNELLIAHDDMVTKVNNIIDNVSPHLDQIGPMLDAIASNPLFKMMAGKKKP